MVTLEEAKLHLHVDDDGEDDGILQMIEAATAAVADYLGSEIPDPMPAPVRAAVLLQIGDLFANRERQGEASYYQNRTYERLLNPYRDMAV
ncbi:MAG: head-tail connector protein [Rhodocyclaceae bacterium]